MCHQAQGHFFFPFAKCVLFLLFKLLCVCVFFFLQELLTKTVSVKCPADTSNIWKWLRLYQDHTKTTYSNASTLPGLSDRAWVLDKVGPYWKIRFSCKVLTGARLRLFTTTDDWGRGTTDDPLAVAFRSYGTLKH